MTCRETQPLLSPFFDGELDPAQMRSVALHSARCPDCEHELHRLERLREVVFGSTTGLVDEVDLSAIWSGVESRIAGVSQPLGPRVRAWLEEFFAGWTLRVPVLAGSGVAAIVALMVWLVPFGGAKSPTGIEVANIDNSAFVNSLDSHVGSVALLNEPETNTSVLWVNEDSPDAAEFEELP